MKKILCKLLFYTSFVFYLTPVLTFGENSKSNPTVVEYNPQKPFIISLKSDYGKGSWEAKLNNNQKGIRLLSKRLGFLFSYFTFKSSSSFKGMLEFSYQDKNSVIKKRYFYVRPSEKILNSASYLYGDIPPDGKGDDFLEEANHHKAEVIENSPSTDQSNNNNNTPAPLTSNSSGVSTDIPSNNTSTESQESSAPESPNVNQDNENSSTDKENPLVSAEKYKNNLPTNSQNSAPDSSSLNSSPLNKDSAEVDEQKVPIDPNFKKYFEALQKSKLFKEAKTALEDYLKRNPESNGIWSDMEKINLNFNLKEYQKVIDYAESIFNNPDKKAKFKQDDLFLLKEKEAFSAEKLGKVNQAQADFLYLTSYFPKKALAYYQLGNFYLRTKQFKKTLSAFTYLTSQFPDFQMIDEIYYKLGNYYYKVVGVNGYNLSLNYYKKILRLGMASEYYKKAKKMVDFLENNLFHPH